MSWSRNIIKTGQVQNAWNLPTLEEANRELQQELEKKLAPVESEPAPEPLPSYEELAAAAKMQAHRAGLEEGKSEGFKQGLETGFAQGHSEGREAGLAEIRAEMEAEKLAHREAMEAEAENLTAKIKDFVEASYEELRKFREAAIASHADFALEVARRAIQSEMKQSPEIVLAIAQSALKELHQGTEFRVLVSPADLEFLDSNRQTILENLTHVRGLEIVPDRTIQGGCMIESESGTIDARIESYLRRMAESILKDAE